MMMLMLVLVLMLMLMLIPMLMIMTTNTVWQNVVLTPASFAWKKEKQDDVPTQGRRKSPDPGEDHELSKSANPNNKFAKSCVGIQGHMQVDRSIV